MARYHSTRVTPSKKKKKKRKEKESHLNLERCKKERKISHVPDWRARGQFEERREDKY